MCTFKMHSPSKLQVYLIINYSQSTIYISTIIQYSIPSSCMHAKALCLLTDLPQFLHQPPGP